MSSESAELMTDMDLDHWSEEDEDNEENYPVQNIDSRRQVENKLDDIRLAKEISEYSFDI